MKKYWATGVASLLLVAGLAIAQDAQPNAAQDSGNTAKVEKVHGSQSSGEVEGRLQKAEEIIDQLTDAKDSAIPEKILKDAKCVAIVPSMVKGGFVFGAQHGRGVASCRVNGRWSTPAFFTATGGTWGAQIGVAGIDLVMVFRNQEGADKLLSGNFKVGGDVTAAAGPIGRDASASTDVKAATAILTYSRAKGAFVGATLEGVGIRPDKDSTIAFYGHDVDFKDALTGKVATTANARPFTHALGKDFRDILADEATDASAH